MYVYKCFNKSNSVKHKSGDQDGFLLRKGDPTRTRGRHRDRAHHAFAASSQWPSRCTGPRACGTPRTIWVATAANTEAPGCRPIIGDHMGSRAHTLGDKEGRRAAAPATPAAPQARQLSALLLEHQMSVTFAHATAPASSGEDAFHPAGTAAVQGFIGDEQ